MESSIACVIGTAHRELLYRRRGRVEHVIAWLSTITGTRGARNAKAESRSRRGKYPIRLQVTSYKLLPRTERNFRFREIGLQGRHSFQVSPIAWKHRGSIECATSPLGLRSSLLTWLVHRITSRIHKHRRTSEMNARRAPSTAPFFLASDGGNAIVSPRTVSRPRRSQWLS